MSGSGGAGRQERGPRVAWVDRVAPRGAGRRGGASDTRHGAGRLLIALYGVFAISATSRAGYQIAVQLTRAPVAYLLSALAAVVYLVAAWSLARATPGSRRVARAAVVLELVGVLGVGTLSLAVPAAFPDQTVWSGYGAGYYYVPLVLPLLGLAWLRRTAPGRPGPAGPAPSPR